MTVYEGYCVYCVDLYYPTPQRVRVTQRGENLKIIIKINKIKQIKLLIAVQIHFQRLIAQKRKSNVDKSRPVTQVTT